MSRHLKVELLLLARSTAGVAQLVELLICNQGVGSSSLPASLAQGRDVKSYFEKAVAIS